MNWKVGDILRLRKPYRAYSTHPNVVKHFIIPAGEKVVITAIDRDRYDLSWWGHHSFSIYIIHAQHEIHYQQIFGLLRC